MRRTDEEEDDEEHNVGAPDPEPKNSDGRGNGDGDGRGDGGAAGSGGWKGIPAGAGRSRCWMDEKLAPLQGRPHATAASLTAETACRAGRTLNSLHDILHVKSEAFG